MAFSARRRAAAHRHVHMAETAEIASGSVSFAAVQVQLRAVKPSRMGCKLSKLPFASISASAGAPQPQLVFDLADAPDAKKGRWRKGKQPASPVEPPPPPPTALRIAAGNLAAGATAGCVVEAALYPLDTIKTRLQLMRQGGGLKALLSSGGGRGLYAGIWGNLVGVAPASAIFMAVYEPVKARLMEHVGQQQAFLGAGAAAGLAASFIRAPTEVVKQRMQAGEFKHATKAVATILAREGPRGMYAGYFAFLLRDLPFDAIEFWAYDSIKYAYRRMVKRELNAAETGAAGAAAGAITGFSTTPLDVLKTRLMTQGTGTEYKNVFDCASRIWREEGARAFLKGWEPRVTWIAIGGFVFFSALEQAKKLFAPANMPPAKEASAH